jgi:transcriptional regulator of acetoin/glycerol metabolism
MGNPQNRNVAIVARRPGVGRLTIHRRMDRLGIDRPE